MDSLPNVTGFILAAGEGRRLRPATLTRPKALIPFCGVPMLDLVAARLTALPLRRLVVNAWYMADVVEAACSELRNRLPCELALSREPRLLDTGGGLRFGLRPFPDAEHVLVHNADVILDVDLDALLRLHLAHDNAVTLVLVPGRGPQTVEADAEGRISNFRRPHGQAPFTFAGVHIFRRSVLDLLPPDESCSIVVAYEAAVAAGQRVEGVSCGDAYWSDLGNPRDYIRAHGEIADLGIRHSPRLREAQAEQARRRAELERRGVRCTGALGLGLQLSVPFGTHLHNAVLWDGTHLGKPALYADSIFSWPAVPAIPPVTPERQPDPRLYFSLDVAPDTVRIEPLRKQGSGRLYARLRVGDRSWVWCAYNHERRENAAFAALADFLDDIGVRIPSVIAHLGDVGEIVSRDLGEHDLQEVTDGPRLDALLRDVLAQVARLHVLGSRAARLQELPLQQGFTKGLYDWERDYFREHILERLLAAPELWAPAAAEYCELRNALLAQPLVPVHRDLQSANVMVVDERPYLIDFQGMRWGCAAYDLGSLLYDPYKQHPAEFRRRLWLSYQEQVAALGGAPTPEPLFHAAAVQRLLQALGAYGKLWRADGLTWYRQFIAPGLCMLGEAADAGGLPRLAELAAQCRSRLRL